MKVLLWQSNCTWLDQLVLWDGEHTYWSEEMRPSRGYTKINFGRWSKHGARFVLLGDL